MTTQLNERLKKMRYWLLGTFLILAAAHITMGMVIPGLLGQTRYLMGLAIAAVLTVAFYYLYRMYLARGQG
jgi:hypothetical protein